MHEVSICEVLVRAILEELQRLEVRPQRLRRARVAAGRLRQIVPDNMDMAYRACTAGTAIDGSALELRETPAVATCPACGWRGEIRPPFFRCGACESLEVRVESGMELYLENLELETDDDGDPGLP
jgi:hydrogenase nickel incorporation protein HypA/HybF